MNIEKKNVKDLLPADYNPRKDLKPGDAEYEKLKRSIEQFGYVEPVIWNKTTRRVVGGHQRLKVLIDMGITEVECVVVELDEEKEKALNIALNKISGDWDKDKLALLIADLQGADFDVSLTGFEPAEIDALFKDTLKDGVKEDDFDVDAELQKPTITKPGDVWTLGRHRLVCGDSTRPETYALLMGDTKANLIITDPPYNVNYEGSAGKIKNDNMASEKFYQFLLDAFTCMESVLADDGSIYVFHADTEGLNFRRAFADAGFYLSGCCIWKKQSLVLGRSPYQWQHEPVLYGWKKKGKHQWYTGRKESTIWEFDKPKKNGDHPTMKPIPLLAYPIMNSSMSNAVVLDPFGGSGSTLIACEQTDRICRTIELDEKFCDVIVKRYIEQVGTDQSVSVLRDGKERKYSEVCNGNLGERFNIREIAFDRWGAVQMVQNLEGMGFTVVPFGQGFKDMSPPTKELMKLVLEEKVAHGGHPVLRWMMDNIFIRTDPAGNIKPDKEKSTEKIDGAVATIMALDRAIRCGNDTGASVYDDRGILFL